MASTATAQVRGALSTETWIGQACLAHTCLLYPAMLGYDDLTQGTAAGDYTKGGYGGSSQAQNKSAGSGPGKGSVCPSFPGLRPRIVISSLAPSQARLPQSAPGGGVAGAGTNCCGNNCFSS